MPVEFPCYELDPTAIVPLTSSDVSWTNPQEPEYNATNQNFVFLDTGDPSADFSAIFPDWANMPHLSTDPGSIIRSECKYELDTGITYSIHDSGITAVAAGVKPADWDSEWMYYGTMYTTPAASDTGYVFKIFTPLVGVNTTTTTVPDPASIWDSNTQYYKMDPEDHDYRLSRLFSTHNNGSFGVSSMQGGYDPAWPTKSPRAGGIAPRGSEYTYAFRNYPFWTMHGYAGDYANFNSHYYISVPVPFVNINAAGYIYGFNWGNDAVSTPMLQYRNQMFIFVHFVHNDVDFWGVALLQMSDETSSAYPTGVRVMAFSENFWGSSIVPDEPAPREENFGGDSTWAGGNGTFTAESDSRGTGAADALDSEISVRASAFDTAINSGGFNVYQILATDMPEIVSILFGTGYLSRFANTMYNPLSAIISYHLLPSNLCSATAVTKPLKAGGYNISAQMAVPTTEYPIMSALTTYFVGSFDFAHYFDAFPDFAPYTTIKLHLPYIGTITIDPAVVMYGSIAIYYVTDVLSGNVAAWVWCKDKNGKSTYIYTATGNAAYSIPMFSQNQDGGAVGKIVGGITQAAIGAATGNALGIIGGVSGVASGAITAASHQTVISGTFGGNTGILCDTVCWLEISRPEWVNPSTYPDLDAIPAEIGGTLLDLGARGLTVVSHVETDGIQATEPEIREIERLLKSGVYIVPPEE